MSTLIDGATGLVIEDGPHRLKSSLVGFGPTVQLFEVSPPRFQPWLTPAMIEEELQLLRYEGVHGE